jgi:hypothetical protein
MRGAVALENAWLKKDSLKDVAVYVVWSPQLGAEEKHVAGATTLVSDPRATHFWDGHMLVGSAYQPLVGSRAAAWDTWMVFDRNAMWRGDSVPRPAWWEHQMSSGPPALMLNADRWASHAIALHDVSGDHR